MGNYTHMIDFVERKLVPLLKCEYFALDLGTLKQRDYFIFEANSAPGLATNSNTRALYAEFIARRIYERLF